ncbi:CRISPR-associated helicase/endonuclease Cas3 [Aggregatibacter actinomycetemcomitans]|uniref:CRISPR-associated helicase/endonuclease Cas3 n=1 Tax=Aggregatibacter actinomycetemcomitans TaxID=714 RepID=A0A5D0EMT7_AGGAC|nr:CRISPR-associated helicase/endonuclease Cas3 [Aggregatibacter actinomycetemcomitans]AFI86062.2 CRISPR-associated protein [Aggregatibacter actinomycetemcomitans D7S-1]KYK97061.1 CRISPR-associated protein [Aggregatibacter actinomycetemcomitans serotype d str. SA3733]AMQ93158.1 CRISPR-associated protein [Aggregatibacter actinomycetemcomitans]ANU82251.1 CRISPR-associated helicase/endonuclease Cas3 [Aggregatibacter actinomycetemcomitans]KND84563.1 CRISPR-associated protein [Aggregatibacter actin
MSRNAIAHVRQSDGLRQLLIDHLFETSSIAGQLASKLNLSLAGELLGLLHDFGKYSLSFQDYIKAATGIDPNADDYVLPGGRKIDHSTAGAQWVYRALRKYGVAQGIGELFGQMLGLCIASHHGEGLIDCLDESGNAVWKKRFEKEDELTHLAECSRNADAQVLQRAQTLAGEELVRELLNAVKPILSDKTIPQKKQEFYLGCLTRFLFSCLIDADRINSSDFEKAHQKDVRRLVEKPDWQDAIEKLENHLAQFAIRYPIDQIRRNISDDCLKRAVDFQGVYTLTVPTGGGKTLASLRYALHHAKKHDLDRIIYIIPYTSIIDQNAAAVREILGEDWVLEHHSNLEPEQQSWQDKLLSENWDKPIVFTTMVQFLDAWFGGGTRGARHIHPMTNSVLIFDEIQTLPVKCVHLFCNVLNWLTQFGKSTAILCTATQPLLGEAGLNHFPENEREKIIRRGLIKLPENAEIMGDHQDLDNLFNALSRVEIQFKEKAGGWTAEDAGEFLLEQFQTTQSCLFIVNTKKWAQQLYQYCEQQNVPPEALFHLSTHQCAAHRKAIFERIKGRLKNGEPVICISTQLIEAGVDISMKCVIRALGGLDSIAQAAGRCNRHGEKDSKGQVYVLNLQEPDFQKVLPDIQEGKSNAGHVFRDFAGQDILQPAAMQRYFQYYFYNRSGEMIYPVKNSATGSLFDWLSDNQNNPYGNKNNKKTKAFPLLMQSFKSAGRAFHVIDAPTRAVIVPYGEGKALIGKLCGEWNPAEMRRALQKSQRYSVNVFPNVWDKLQKDQAVHETIEGSGIYYLNERYYNDAFGLSLDETSNMTFYDL